MAMYSGILIIVETSLSGLGGSGARQTSAVERMRRMSRSPRQPANSIESLSPSSAASARISLEHVALADEDGVPVVAALAQPREGMDRVLDAVLRPHDPEVGDQVRAAASQLGVGLGGAEAFQVRPVADDEDILGSLPATLDRDAAIGVVRGEHDVGEPEGDALGAVTARSSARLPPPNFERKSSGTRS